MTLPSDHTEVLTELSQSIKKRGLQAPAVFFLEMHKPLIGLFEAFALISAPLTSLLFGAKYSRIIPIVFSSVSNVECLIRLLEDGGVCGD